jgi:hypothetical protein
MDKYSERNLCICVICVKPIRLCIAQIFNLNIFLVTPLSTTNSRKLMCKKMLYHKLLVLKVIPPFWFQLRVNKDKIYFKNV